MIQHTLHAAAFPVLSDSQVAEMANCAPVVSRLCADDERLISVGDRSAKFYIVKAGRIEILDFSGDMPRTIAFHDKGEFTGDISHLTGAPSCSGWRKLGRSGRRLSLRSCQ